MLLTIVLATLSWFLVEKPSLALKKYSINPLNLKRVSPKLGNI
jgi:peptidoglycan/LPS O-acetylase OafA/YrhL